MAEQPLVNELHADRAVVAQHVDEINIPVQADAGTVSILTDGLGVVRVLVAGINSLPTDYSARIQNFLVEYLGTPDHPVPFGGRAAELSLLDGWLADPKASPYLLLGAPAGAGKSALLSRWIRRLTDRADLAVTFMPISVRFRTNLATVVFGSLAARLASSYRQTLPATMNAAEEWRTFVSGLLRTPVPEATSVLVILDGIDEAADWELGADLFPRDPPPRLRVVVSTRLMVSDAEADDWLARIGWDQRGVAQTLTLGSLDRSGVEEVVHAANIAPLADLRGDLADQLLRLTKGDPLLIRLYVDHLAGPGSSGLRLEDLPNVPPGLDGYFTRWWDEQRTLWGDQRPLREPAVTSVLSLLARALGPLTADDLLSLEPTLNSWTLDDTLRPLRRFVLGDGNRQGFAFAHPRLATYFSGRLVAGERDTIDSRFVDLGAKIVAQLAAGEALERAPSAYVAQYYSTHLRLSGKYDTLSALLREPAWYEAQSAADASGSLYVNDVQQAWALAESTDAAAVAEGHPPPLLEDEARLALTTCTMHSLSRNLPAPLLRVLVEDRRWGLGQALAAARSNPDASSRARALVSLAEFIPADARVALLREALNAVRALDDTGVWEYERREILVQVAAQAPPQLCDDVLSIARGYSGPERAVALAQVLSFLPVDRQPTVLEEVLETIRQEPEVEEFGRNPRVAAYSDVLPVLPAHARVEVTDEALACARGTVSPEWRAKGLAWLASSLAPPLRDDVVTSGLQLAQAVDDRESRSQVLEALGPSVPSSSAGDYVRAALQLNWRPGLVDVLQPIAPKLSLELVQEALSELIPEQQGEPDFDTSTAAACLLPRLAEVGEPSRALALARSFPASDLRSGTLALIAPVVARRGDTAAAFAIVHEIEDAPSQVLALAALVEVNDLPNMSSAIQQLLGLVQTGIVQKSLAWGGENQYQERIGELAVRLVQRGMSRDGVALARALPLSDAYDQRPRIRILGQLLPLLSGEARAEAVRDALTASRAVEDREQHARAIGKLATYLPTTERVAFQTQALELAQSVAHVENRARLLIDLLPELPAEMQSAAALRGLDDAREAFEVSPGGAQVRQLLSHLNAEDAAAVLADWHDAIEHGVWAAELLGWLADVLPPATLPLALERARTLEAIDRRVWVTARLLSRPEVPTDVRQAALSQAFDDIESLPLTDDLETSPRGDALSHAMSLVDQTSLERALTILREVAAQSAGTYTSLLAGLAPRLAELGQWRDALDVVSGIGWRWQRANALAAVVPFLPDEALGQALELATGLESAEDPYARGIVAGLVARLPQAPLAVPLAEVLVDAASGQRPYNAPPADLLAQLAMRATPPDLEAALEQARDVSDAQARGRVLARLAAVLPEADRVKVFSEALEIAEAIEDIDDKAAYLQDVVAGLPPRLAPRALRAITSVGGTKYIGIQPRADALAALAPTMTQLPREVLYSEWRQALHVLASRNRLDLLWDLSALAPVLLALGGPGAIHSAITAITEIEQRWP